MCELVFDWILEILGPYIFQRCCSYVPSPPCFCAAATTASILAASYTVSHFLCFDLNSPSPCLYSSSWILSTAR